LNFAPLQTDISKVRFETKLVIFRTCPLHCSTLTPNSHTRIKDFADTLETQLRSGEKLGENLSLQNMDFFNSHQISQLHEIQKETTKLPLHSND